MDIEKLIEKKQPFAVIKYYERLKKNEYQNSVYELLTINNAGEKVNQILKGCFFYSFITNKDKLNLVLDNSDGKVWEFMNYKKVYKNTLTKK